MLPTIEWRSDMIVMVDQRKLPKREVYVECRTVAKVVRAIKSMVIRGAPAIGVAAAMGLALGVNRSKASGTTMLAREFYKMCDAMAETRPTAVNLFWAIARMKRIFANAVKAGESVEEIRLNLEVEARRIHDADVEACRALGAHGATILPTSARVLTHCNAGWLATVDFGTATAPIYCSQKKKINSIYIVEDFLP